MISVSKFSAMLQVLALAVPASAANEGRKKDVEVHRTIAQAKRVPRAARQGLPGHRDRAVLWNEAPPFIAGVTLPARRFR